MLDVTRSVGGLRGLEDSMRVPADDSEGEGFVEGKEMHLEQELYVNISAIHLL